MPTYDYRCEANGRTIEVAHPMSEHIQSWGELCKRAGIPVGDVSPDESVAKIIPLVAARGAAAPEPEGPCGSSCGCFPG